MPGKSVRWTPSEEDELIRLWEKGFTVTFIARQMGRTYTSIIDRLQKLRDDGVIVSAKHTPTQEEIDEICRLRREGWKAWQIADECGIKVGMVYYILQKNGVKKPPAEKPKRKSHKWTQEEIKAVKRLHAEGKSAKEIAAILGVSVNGVTCKLYYEGKKK